MIGIRPIQCPQCCRNALNHRIILTPQHQQNAVTNGFFAVRFEWFSRISGFSFFHIDDDEPAPVLLVEEKYFSFLVLFFEVITHHWWVTKMPFFNEFHEKIKYFFHQRKKMQDRQFDGVNACILHGNLEYSSLLPKSVWNQQQNGLLSEDKKKYRIFCEEISVE